jgi:Domain of unknown function (DUF222)
MIEYSKNVIHRFIQNGRWCMPQEPFPDCEPDDPGPDSSGSPVGGNGPDGAGQWFEDDKEGPEQGLFVCLPAEQLTRTLAALAAGRLHPVHVRIIEDETRVLSAEDAAAADEILAEAARSQTFGQLRYAAHRLVLKLDPDAARRRKQAATREAHVRRFREDSGNAGMVARELPPDEVLASWQHVEQRALDLRAAGLPGTLTELRVRAYLDLLQERDSRVAPGDPVPAGAGQAGPPGPWSPSCGPSGLPSPPGEPGPWSPQRPGTRTPAGA